MVTAFLSCFVTVSFLLPIAACQNSAEPSVKDRYVFVYNVNYAGGRNRTVEIAAGKTASQYNASRSGYVLDGWFYEKECETVYDFATPVNKDTTIYALWTDENTIVYHDVTFDYGEGFTKTGKYRDGKSVDSYTVMESQKLGYDIVGWFLDESLTDEFVLDVDPVESEITLYAKYVPAEGVSYTDDGDFDFQDVKITIGFEDNHGIGKNSGVAALIDDFNRAYQGKISASIGDSGEAASIVFNQTELINRRYSNYFSMEEALALAGKSFSQTQYYQNQINDCYIDGALYTMPVGSFVPMVVYNKSLMEKYNPVGVLPNSHDAFMQLLQTVHEGESKKETWQGTLTMSISWDMMEIAANNFYLQNDLPLYSVGTNGRYGNQWLNDTAATERILRATNDFRDMFIKENSVGRITGQLWGSGEKAVKWSYVGSGDSFMGVMGVPNANSIFGYRVNQSGRTLFEKTVGVMPVYHVFASQSVGDSSQKIFVKNFSLAIPKYSKNDMAEVAAAAVFADFMSKYCEKISEAYIYPANKLAQRNMFNGLQRYWAVDYLFAECGDPSDFYTYPGASYEYNVINSIHSSFLTNKLYWLDDNAADEAVMNEIETLCKKINEEIGA